MRAIRFLTLAGLVILGGCTGSGAGDGGRAGDGGSVGEPIEAPGIEEPALVLVAPPEEGAGEVPTFEWEAVEAAAAYRLVVLNADGDATWAWEGPETSVTLGGVSDRSPEAGGPVITPGSSWSVAALDADGHALAASPIRPVSP